MKKYRQWLYFSLCFWLLISEVVWANDFDKPLPNIVLSSDAGLAGIVSDVNQVSQREGNFDFLKVELVEQQERLVPLVKINMIAYKKRKLTLEQREAILEATLKSIKESNDLSKADKARFYRFIETQDSDTARVVAKLGRDSKADIARAYAWYRPFSGPISTFLGVLTFLIFMGFSFSLLLDLSYVSGELFGSVLELTAKAGQRPFGVSQIAYNAKKDYETHGKGTPTGWYLRSAVVHWLGLSITLMYLIGAKLFDLASAILDLFGSGV